MLIFLTKTVGEETKRIPSNVCSEFMSLTRGVITLIASGYCFPLPYFIKLPNVVLQTNVLYCWSVQHNDVLQYSAFLTAVPDKIVKKLLFTVK